MEIDFGFAKAIISEKSDGDYRYKDGIVFANQIHSNIVKRVNSHESFDGDGLITKEKDLKIGVYLADCMPIFIIDHKSSQICVLHSGRAGAFKDIFSNGFKMLNSKSEDVEVYLGPSIKKCCYEVGLEIESEANLLGYGYAIDKRNDKIYLDTLSIIKDQILKNGILKDQVTIDESCTCCSDRYFSYRKDKTSKRFAAYIWIKGDSI